jgi:hypothetical protein
MEQADTECLLMSRFAPGRLNAVVSAMVENEEITFAYEGGVLSTQGPA